jgi:hypothetical protein
MSRTLRVATAGKPTAVGLDRLESANRSRQSASVAVLVDQLDFIQLEASIENCLSYPDFADSTSKRA